MRMLMRAAWFLLGLVVVAFGILAVNQQSVGLRFLVWQSPELSLFWWLLLAFLAGLLVGGVSAALVSFRRRLEVRSLNRQLASAERERVRLQEQVQEPGSG